MAEEQQPDVYIATTDAVVTIDGEFVRVRRNITRVSAGHPLLADHGNLFKPAGEDVHFGVRTAKAEPTVPDPAGGTRADGDDQGDGDAADDQGDQGEDQESDGDPETDGDAADDQGDQGEDQESDGDPETDGDDEGESDEDQPEPEPEPEKPKPARSRARK